ncbi:maestro heat-like repeat-containing protein family member 9 isoform X2 [Felis catus]|uniref:maestro heat-like repeat-containing protein family member 9 isoform X2 n=1 Tax=Felis catus TaxID=9685 RepID=UPI001D19B51A|nr:maestro heat-like repeat-containing protein family member 9 isoform X2 [Felis catus]
MTSKIQKTSKNLGYSKDKVTGLQCLRSSVKWHRLEHIATSLWDVYSGLFGDQAMILAVNSSFVDPSLQFESQLKIIESSFKKVFSIPSLEKVRQMGNSEDDKEDIENLYQNILNMYEDTLLILVSKDLYKLQILKDMAMWMNEDSSYLQERAIVVISRVLSFASRKVRGYASVDAPCLGVLAAELSLLCCHNDVSITQQASLGMHHLLCIAKCQNEDIEKTKSTKYEKHGNHCLLSPSSVQEFVPKVLQRDRAKIAQSVGQTLMPSLLTDFVWSLLMTLSSPNCVTAFKASTILKLTLEYHAHKVTMVSKIVDAIYKKLRENSSHAMRQAMLRVTTLLTRTSPKKVIFQLMDYPVPADDTLILMWHAAGSESSVAPHVLKTILLILKGKPGEVHASLPERRRFSLDTTNMMPVAASQALCTLLPVGSYKKAVAQFFPQLLMALMLQVFYISELRLVTEDRPLTLSEYNFPQFPETLQYLYKLSVEGPRRSEDTVITVIFFTELLNNFFKDPFPEEFLVLFRNWVNDSNPAVSKLSLQKIANMAPVINEIENVCSLLISILDAFLSKEKTVIIRALLTLRRLLGKLDKVTYSSLCIRIASSYCPLMDHSNEGIRSMAIRHFGELLRDMSHYTWMLNDVVLGGLVPLILFLEDTDISVVKACRHTLTICTSELNWSTSSLLKDKYYNFELVVLNICNNLLVSHENYITDLISDTLGFLRSSRIYLRKASVILIGYLAKSGGHLLLRDEIEVMLEAIDRVLWDEDPIIRQLAEITHKIFKEIAHRLTSSHVKQTFRRLFHFIYIKKLKPLYNYNWPNNLASSPMKIKETDGDKEGLTDENYVYMFVKNET